MLKRFLFSVLLCLFLCNILFAKVNSIVISYSSDLEYCHIIPTYGMPINQVYTITENLDKPLVKKVFKTYKKLKKGKGISQYKSEYPNNFIMELLIYNSKGAVDTLRFDPSILLYYSNKTHLDKDIILLFLELRKFLYQKCLEARIKDADDWLRKMGYELTKKK